MSIVRIYAMCCPITGEPRYVGRTVNSLKRRLGEHVSTALRGKMQHKQKEDWIRILVAAGTGPSIRLLEEANATNFKEREKYWVAKFRENGWIVNARCGGDGGMGGHRLTWTPCLDAMLGVEPDAVVAERLGCTRKAVAYRRERLGVKASFNRRRNTPPPRSRPILLDRLSGDSCVVDRLGKEPDHVLAKSIGVSKRTIFRLRKMLGIKPYAENGGISGKFGDGRKKQHMLHDGDERLQILGTMTDIAAASFLGVSHNAARNARIRMGIPSYRSKRK